MAQVDKSARPFYDDFNEDKKFYDILFRPGFAVQTRELNQIQSIFYSQQEKFADHIFEEGSIVIPGNVSYDLNYDYVTCVIELPENFSNFEQYIKTNEVHLLNNTGLTAKIVGYSASTENDPETFYVQYLNGGNSGTESRFSDLEDIRIRIVSTVTTLAEGSVITTGVGSKITVDNGIYYLNGKFVLVNRQTIPLDKYSNRPTKTVGFEYTETIVTPLDDSSLYDNAQDSPNFSAPGAYRTKVDAVLTSYDTVADGSDDFIEIFRIRDGQLQKMARGPSYNVLGDTLARRTYDESGNYEVEGFPIYVREHLKDGNNQGVFTVENGGDESKFVSQIGSGLAYVKGYESRILSSKNVVHDKARSSEVNNNYSLSIELGYYLEATSITNVPDLNDYQSVELKDSLGTTVGTARVKSVSFFNSKYRVYLFDVRDTNSINNTSFISQVRSIEGGDFVASVVEEDAILKGTENASSIFSTSFSYLKSLINPLTSESDTSFTVLRQYSVTSDSAGNVVLSAPSNGTFLVQNPLYSFASFTDVNNDLVDISSISTLGGTPAGKTITISFGTGYENRPARVNVLTSIDEATTKPKTITQGTVTGIPSSGVLSLGKADVIRVIQVLDENTNDVTDQFLLNKNIRKSYYGVSSITGPTSFSGEITVTFEYFQHGTGDYFCVDSYASIDYADIPVEDGVRLSDVIDFRPRISDDGTSFTGVGSSRVIAPAPDSVFRADVEYYLPRKDKIVINENGEVSSIKGVPELNPNYPATPSNSMALYQLDIPAYTLDVSKVVTSKVSTPRYTMEDISRLEDRIDNLDYYMTLSLLEKDAADLQVVDPLTGLNRFKNGFLVDPFNDHSVGDSNWSEYHCAIGDGDLRPEMRFNAVDFEVNESTMNGLRLKNGILTLDYNEEVFVEQNLRSEFMNVNPYAVFRWEGEIELDPSVDNWVDVVYTAPRIITRTVTRTRTVTNPSQSWQNNATVLSSSSSSSSITIEPHAQFVNPVATDFGATTTASRTTTTTTTSNLQSTSTSSSSRSGGESVLSNEWLPFMRSRDVEVNGEGHKPETKLNFFFDDIPVNQYIRPVNGEFGDDIITNNEGDFEAVFNVPNNDELQIPVGTKLFVATDNEDARRELALSWGETEYTATSRRETRQRTIIRTRVRTVERATVTNTSTNTTTWWDPLAQSFLVEESGGMFLTKVDLFFLSKDQNLPVHVDIREMENGQPTQRIVPGSRTLLKPSQVIETEDGSVPSTFEFKYPVYLEEGREYCIMIWANSIDYNVWVARMGDKDLGSEQYIAKQPYMGVLFKSQNSSTWTEDQNADLQFRLHRAVFTSSGSASLVNKDLPKIRYNKTVLFSESGSNEVTVKIDRHNFIVGTNITIEGALGGNGIQESNINGQHIVTEVLSQDELKIQVSDVATYTGGFGGSQVEISDTAIASFFNLNCNDIEYNGTSISYTATGMSGQSYSGDEIPYQPISSPIVLEKGGMNSLRQPWMITNKNDEVANFNGNTSMTINASLSTTNSNVSPVIDMYAYNLICPYYMIDGDINNIEPSGTNAYTKYRTNPAGLSTPANSLKVYLDTVFDQNSDVIVSCKVGNSQEEVEMSDEWVEIPKTVNISTTNDKIAEIEYELSDSLSDFTFFQIMIQLKSKSNTRIPVCRNLRVIALGT